MDFLSTLLIFFLVFFSSLLTGLVVFFVTKSVERKKIHKEIENIQEMTQLRVKTLSEFVVADVLKDLTSTTKDLTSLSTLIDKKPTIVFYFVNFCTNCTRVCASWIQVENQIKLKEWPVHCTKFDATMENIDGVKLFPNISLYFNSNGERMREEIPNILLSPENILSWLETCLKNNKLIE